MSENTEAEIVETLTLKLADLRKERIADLMFLEGELAGTKDLLRIANDEIERLGKPHNDKMAPVTTLIMQATHPLIAQLETAIRERDEARAALAAKDAA